MSNRFHNKFHRHNHHTEPTADPKYPDSGYDPIASPQSPFKGEFYAADQITTTDSFSAGQHIYAVDGNFSRNVTVSQVLSTLGNAYFDSNVEVTGSLTVDGNGQFNQNVGILNDLLIGNDLIVENNANIQKSLVVDENLTVFGNLSVLGDTSQVDTKVFVTSALEITNVGTGPALKVTQTGNQPIAHFIDSNGGDVVINDDGFLGIATLAPTERFTLFGNVTGTHTKVAFNNSEAQGTFCFSANVGSASGVNSFAEGSGRAHGIYAHAEGSNTVATGFGSHAEGDNTIASGYASHAAGFYSEAAHDRTWVWKGSTSTQHLSTTRANQFMVSAAGGAAFFGNVGINTDTIENALTVVGDLSTKGSLKLAEGTTPANGIVLGDTNFYRSTTNTLKTDDNLIVDLNLSVNGNTNIGSDITDSFLVNAGTVNYPNLTSTSNALVLGGDTNLYRTVANVLKTDDSLQIDQKLILGYGTGVNDGAEIYMDYSAGGDNGVLIISTRDNAGEAIVFRQRQDSSGPPPYQVEPLIIGTNQTVGVGAPSGTRSFEDVFTVYGNISATGNIKAANIPQTTLTTSVCAMSGNGGGSFIMNFTNGLLTSITE